MKSKEFKKEYNLVEFNNTFAPVDESDDIELSKQFGPETTKSIKNMKKEHYWIGLGDK